MSLFLLICLIGLGTFLIRLLPLFFADFFNARPHLLENLQVLPALIFAALISPSFFSFRMAQTSSDVAPMLVAGLATIVCARLTNSVIWATMTGMVCLYFVNSFL